MDSIIIKPKNNILKPYVQYFLFFKKETQESLTYTTFPNVNLCLAIYKQNEIIYVSGSGKNNCMIKAGSKTFVSRFYGFHKIPFKVDIEGVLDQICILFYPSALRAFTGEEYPNLMGSENVFEVLTQETAGLEELFEETNSLKRAELMESLLIQKLKNQISPKLEEALFQIHRLGSEPPTMEGLARELHTSTSTLYRLFKNHLGQNSKSYLKTIRFRNSLKEMLQSPTRLTEIAYSNYFFDQAHFTKDFKIFTGYTPKELLNKVSVQQKKLAWVYNTSPS